MNRTVHIVLSVLCAALTAHAQGVYVYCTRDVDGAKIQADSIRVECVEYGIDTVVKGSVFELPAITDVHQEGPLTYEYIEYELFDLRGCALGRQRSSTMQGGLQWVDHLGVVFVRRLSAVSSDGGKFGTQILDIPQLRVTAWRDGYKPATSASIYPTKENVGVHLVLELKPWWYRLWKVHVTVTAPRVQYAIDGFEGHGATARSWHYKGVKSSSFDLTVGYWTTSLGVYVPWEVSNGSATYEYYNEQGGGASYTAAEMEIDTTANRVLSLRLRISGSLSHDRESRSVQLKSLPDWSIMTPGMLDVHLVDSTADASVSSISYKYVKSLTPGLPAGGSETTTEGPHIPTAHGTLVGCTIYLKE